jgi:hypothetical protein
MSTVNGAHDTELECANEYWDKGLVLPLCYLPSLQYRYGLILVLELVAVGKISYSGVATMGEPGESVVEI